MSTLQAWSTARSGGLGLQMALSGGQRRGTLRLGSADVRLCLLSCFSMALAACSRTLFMILLQLSRLVESILLS